MLLCVVRINYGKRRKLSTSRGGFLAVQQAVEDVEVSMFHKIEWIK